MKKPVLAITMGDAAGIGPELIVKVLAQRETYEVCAPFIVGSTAVISKAIAAGAGGPQIKRIASVSEARFEPRVWEVLEPDQLAIPNLTIGRLDPALGKAAALCMQKAYRLAMQNEIDGVVGAPLNKEGFHAAGYNYPDELAYISELTGSPSAFTMGLMGKVWTVTIAEHVAFRRIADMITSERVLDRIRAMNEQLAGAGFGSPRLAVAALNVHGGEGGLFGREEIDVIGPAVEEAQLQGIVVSGPLPADTVFVRATQGEFDGVVCMYHDQANIARKLHARRSGATFFIGLPVPGGTTAHGTAFDIAGKSIADPGSLAEALKYTAAFALAGAK